MSAGCASYVDAGDVFDVAAPEGCLSVVLVRASSGRRVRNKDRSLSPSLSAKGNPLGRGGRETGVAR